VVHLAVPTIDHVPVCTTDPERWTTTDPDDEAKALCRQCPLRWPCARDGWETPGAEGLWAGVVIPESGRGRDFARRQLRSLAAHGGYPVRPGLRGRYRTAPAARTQ
jgi:WhiB family redox-sensing transcriptional regulator